MFSTSARPQSQHPLPKHSYLKSHIGLSRTGWNVRGPNGHRRGFPVFLASHQPLPPPKGYTAPRSSGGGLGALPTAGAPGPERPGDEKLTCRTRTRPKPHRRLLSPATLYFRPSQRSFLARRRLKATLRALTGLIASAPRPLLAPSEDAIVFGILFLVFNKPNPKLGFGIGKAPMLHCCSRQQPKIELEDSPPPPITYTI